ncbi:unnamed protein product [Amoebophrya sp. A120]|nr:unnamed protein product [Amoebophrya sp. A120]|eukprot:GSA120T00009810001.1
MRNNNTNNKTALVTISLANLSDEELHASGTSFVHQPLRMNLIQHIEEAVLYLFVLIPQLANYLDFVLPFEMTVNLKLNNNFNDSNQQLKGLARFGVLRTKMMNVDRNKGSNSKTSVEHQLPTGAVAGAAPSSSNMTDSRTTTTMSASAVHGPGQNDQQSMSSKPPLSWSSRTSALLQQKLKRKLNDVIVEKSPDFLAQYWLANKMDQRLLNSGTTIDASNALQTGPADDEEEQDLTWEEEGDEDLTQLYYPNSNEFGCTEDSVVDHQQVLKRSSDIADTKMYPKHVDPSTSRRRPQRRRTMKTFTRAASTLRLENHRVVTTDYATTMLLLRENLRMLAKRQGIKVVWGKEQEEQQNVLSNVAKSTRSTSGRKSGSSGAGTATVTPTSDKLYLRKMMKQEGTGSKEADYLINTSPTNKRHQQREQSSERQNKRHQTDTSTAEDVEQDQQQNMIPASRTSSTSFTPSSLKNLFKQTGSSVLQNTSSALQSIFGATPPSAEGKIVGPATTTGSASSEVAAEAVSSGRRTSSNYTPSPPGAVGGTTTAAASSAAYTTPVRGGGGSAGQLLAPSAGFHSQEEEMEPQPVIEEDASLLWMLMQIINARELGCLHPGSSTSASRTLIAAAAAAGQSLAPEHQAATSREVDTVYPERRLFASASKDGTGEAEIKSDHGNGKDSADARHTTGESKSRTTVGNVLSHARQDVDQDESPPLISGSSEWTML